MKDSGTKTLNTKRLILRRFEFTDISNIFNSWVTDENTCKFTSWKIHKDVGITYDYVSNIINSYDYGNYNWLVELADSHELIGNISVIHLNKLNNNGEIGYCYSSKYWNNGYATEALIAVLDYLLNECELHLVEAKHYSTNPVSGKVMEKAGMKQEAILKERRFDKNTEQYCDLIYYYKSNVF